MVGIQADDLTGACDTGAVFAARGLETVVLLPGAPPLPEPEILALDTESRGLSSAEARARARTVATDLAAHRPAVLYKKVDSTLRGAVSAELGGALEGSGLHHVFLAPALPAQRRILVDGVLHVDGRRADEDPIASDPAFPVTGASVLALLGIEGPDPVGPIGIIPLATVRRGAAAVAARLDRWASTGRGAVVCDAETDADLQVLAAAVAGRPALLTGSAGLAAALAARIPATSLKPTARLRRPLLVVAGSGHPATRAQVERLSSRGVGGTWLRGDGTEESQRPRLAGDDRFIAARANSASDPSAAREAMAMRLAETTRRHLERAQGASRPGSLLLTGGETAVAVCRALGATGLRLGGEMEPGLAQGSLLDGPFAGVTVVTKAGGFGDADTLVRVWEACA